MGIMSIAILKKNLIFIPMKRTGGVKYKNTNVEKVILRFGGTVKLAKKLDANPSHVSQWLYGTRPFPVRHAVKIEKLTKGEIKAKDLRPDIFED